MVLLTLATIGGSYTFGTQITGTAPAINNDMLKGLGTGTDARTRIGNKIKPQYLKGSFTFQAALVDTTTTKVKAGRRSEQQQLTQNWII